ncbi:hypothetical protein [uncultured Methanobacterium sp.]|uniref:hypothetical protein n=1 Tax=uncultured Methanobacterium sp. TaxID=176306 RepID=UPI002AA87834|nr:hypothetical protein [uncultured Methanobacterium sp.]
MLTGMILSDIVIVKQYLEEIDAISSKYNVKRDEVIDVVDKIHDIKVPVVTVVP